MPTDCSAGAGKPECHRPAVRAFSSACLSGGAQRTVTLDPSTISHPTGVRKMGFRHCSTQLEALQYRLRPSSALLTAGFLYPWAADGVKTSRQG